MKGRVGTLLRVAVSVGLLLVLFRAVDFGTVVGQLRQARPWPLAGAVILYCVAGTYVRGERWRRLVVAQGHPMRLTRAIELFLVGTLFGQALPTGIGGDVVRALIVARDGLARSRAFTTVLVDRALGLLPLLATGLVALAVAPGHATRVVSAMMLVAGAAGVVGMVAILRAHRWRGRFERVPLAGWLLRRPAVARFIDAFGDYDTRSLLVATAWSLVFIGLLIVSNMLLGRAVGIDSAGLADWSIVVPLVSLSLLLPSVGGWGVRELSYVALLRTLTPPVDVHAATAMSILFGSLNLVLAAAGGVLTAAGGSVGLPDIGRLGRDAESSAPPAPPA
jgi:glycosyltransferase 2 family protein